MGAKKKAAKGSAKPGEEEEDTSTKDLFYIYKKQSNIHEAIISKTLEKKFQECFENEENLKEILVTEKICWNGARALSDSLKIVNKSKGYKHCEAIRMWDADIGDEGVRAFIQFMIDTENMSFKLLEFLNCGITSLGCEFIARLFVPPSLCNIEVLNLDYNQFGNDGLAELMIGLKTNKSLTYLSLAYCKIEAEGMVHFQEYVANPECTLANLVLQGNNLGNIGVGELSQYLINNNSIESLNLNNVQFGNNDDAINTFVSLITTNTNIYDYKLKYNLITSQDFEKILKAYKGESGKHLYEIELDERIPKELFDDYIKAKKSHKKPKKKVAKKGKKKKK